jgi:hypothetical protein
MVVVVVEDLVVDVVDALGVVVVVAPPPCGPSVVTRPEFGARSVDPPKLASVVRQVIVDGEPMVDARPSSEIELDVALALGDGACIVHVPSLHDGVR